MGILEDKARARLFYRFLSRIYDRINPLVWTEEMRTEAIDLLDLEPDDAVLDVGCGTGFATTGLLEHVETIHGLDQSSHQLSRAAAKLDRDRVTLYRGDAERLPFRSASFDVVWSSGSIEYWPDPVATLQEFRRVGKPGGQVLVVGPDAPDSRVARALVDAIMLFYDEEEADRMFDAAGFVDVSHTVQQARPGSPRAITTVAHVPDAGSEATADAQGLTTG